MYIKDLQIERFGLYQDVNLTDIPSGLCIFYGENEAGKSTCLECLRSLLTGFATRGPKYALTRSQDRIGGFLGLVLENGERLSLGRFKENKGFKVLLRDQEGLELPLQRLSELFAGVSRETYEMVYGFSLQELEKAFALADVQDVLASATFGADLREPGTVLRELSDAAGKFYAQNRRSQGVIRSLLNEISGLDTKIHELTEENARYDLLALKKAKIAQSLAGTREELTAREEELRLLERRLNAWQQWDEWQALRLKLEQMGPSDTNFPEQGALRLSELEHEYRQCAGSLARQEKKFTEVRNRRDGLNVDVLLLKELPLLRRLSESRAGYREALGRLAAQENNCASIGEELDGTLRRLGSGWSCERIHQTDLSIFRNNDLEATAIDLRAAQSAKEAAVAAMEQANRDEEIAEKSRADAQAALEAVPTAEALLNDEERDELRHILARIEEADRQLPAMEQNITAAKTAFQRSWNTLSLRRLSPDEGSQVLRNLLDEQQTVHKLAASVEQSMNEAMEAEKNRQQLEERLKGITTRMEALRASRNEDTPDSHDLDQQAVAVRRLRELLQKQESDLESLHDLETELASEPAPTSGKQLPLIILGGVLAATGCVMLVLNIVLHMTSLPLTEHLSIPLTLWSGYLVLFAGVLGIWGGSPHDSAELKRRQLELKRKEERRTTLKNRCENQKAEIGRLAERAHIEDFDPVVLDAVEVRIQRDKEQCIAARHVKNDISAVQQELDAISALHARAEETVRNKHEAEQKARQTWQDRMLALGVHNVPDVAAAQSFLTRVEMTLMSYEGVKNAEQAFEATKSERAHLLNQVKDYAPVSAGLSEKNEAEEIDAQVVTSKALEVLDLCREADRLREQRTAAKAREAACADECARMRSRREETRVGLEKAEQQLVAVSSRWEHCLKGLGLDSTLMPDTASEALRCMQDCLGLERTLKNAEQVLARTKEEISAFERAIIGILSRTEEDENVTDYLARFDTLLEEAHCAERMQREKDALATVVTDEENELERARLSLSQAQDNIQALLALAGTDSAEDFRRLDRLNQERREIERRRNDLEAALKVIAGQQDLNDFLAGFEGDERAAQERRQDELKALVESLEAQKTAQTREVTALELKLEEMSKSDSLSVLLQQRAGLVKSLASGADQWLRLTLAHALLDRTRSAFERERQPEVLKKASDIFSRITGGAWQRIVISLDKDRTMRMLRTDSIKDQAPETLSRGSQEQAYLALRLAYILMHAENAESLPLLMDEILVNFDSARSRACAKEFARLAKGGLGKSHQIFYFTCHKETVELLSEQNAGATLFLVDKGGLTRA